MRDLYEILMLHEKAIPEVVHQVYRLLARRYHPDVHPPEAKAEAQRLMTELNLAYQVLSDPAERAEYDRKRGMGLPAQAAMSDVDAVEMLLKCFNHPRRAAVAFCWDCGRAVCGECVAPRRPIGELEEDYDLGRTICRTCVRRSEDLETRLRAGRRADPTGRWLERPMRVRGALAYYALVGVAIAGFCGLVFWGAQQVGAEQGQAATYALAVGALYFLLIVYRMFVRLRCPNCGAESGPLDFRRIAPWRDALRPHPVCHRCGRHFLKQEVTAPLD
ncbi:MAG: hypothetical protein FJX74_08910 [Armatimonadetes bacterium]|nr:hypothetical protein [Armatimonadota bacterium]